MATIHPTAPIWVNDYIGIPFVCKGRSRAGVDCWGLFCLVYHEQLGIELPGHLNTYIDTSDLAVLSGNFAAGERSGEWVRIAKDEAVAGDLVLLRIKGLPAHVGMLIEPDRMLHVREGCNTCIESIEAHPWKNRVMGFFRHAH